MGVFNQITNHLNPDVIMASWKDHEGGEPMELTMDLQQQPSPGNRGVSGFQSPGPESPGTQYDNVSRRASSEGRGNVGPPHSGQGERPGGTTQSAQQSVYTDATQSARSTTKPARKSQKRTSKTSGPAQPVGPIPSGLTQKVHQDSSTYWQQNPEEAAQQANARPPPLPCPITYAP
jgi:hypothetical protein